MKKLFFMSAMALTACQAASDQPKNFEDLLTLTDATDAQICNLSVDEVLQSTPAEQLEAAKADAFDTEKIIEAYADDPVAQIRVLFRRAALRRRLLAGDGDPELANTFYEDLKASDTPPKTVKDYHDGFHYWMARLGEQSDYGPADSAAFNLRFCVANEKRAALHAASRADIMARVEKGVTLPAPGLVENINHETTFPDSFTADMLAKIFTEENVAGLSPLERAQMRGDQAFLPTDHKTVDKFWAERDAEIAAMLNYIQSHNFATTAEKLSAMTDIDQSLRKLWFDTEAKAHFDDDEIFNAFKPGVSERVVKVDEFNTAELQNMLEGRGWFRDDIDGAGAAAQAWLIAQHADRNPEFQEVALGLIEAELDAPGVSKSNYAYLYDRVQMRFGDEQQRAKKLQRYATQGRCTGLGTWEPLPYENPDAIDATRAEVGLGTLAEYKARFKTMCTEDQR